MTDETRKMLSALWAKWSKYRKKQKLYEEIPASGNHAHVVDYYRYNEEFVYAKICILTPHRRDMTNVR